MQNLIVVLQKMATAAIHEAFGSSLDEQLALADVAPSTQPQFGQYQCNSALKIAKALKKSPREVAQAILSHLEITDPSNKPILAHLDIAGPGFINMTLDTTFLAEEIEEVLRDPRLGVPPLEKKQRVVVEFSSVNIAKEMHVGHLRSTIIGDCLARVFEFLGHDVLRLNHVGDWGTQFGMLITHMRDHHKDVLEGKKTTDLLSLMTWYRESKARFDAEPEFKKRAQLQVVALQGGDPQAIAAWKMICEISRQGFQEIYDLLDVKLIERGESFYNPLLPKTIERAGKKRTHHDFRWG